MLEMVENASVRTPLESLESWSKETQSDISTVPNYKTKHPFGAKTVQSGRIRTKKQTTCRNVSPLSGYMELTLTWWF
jgi:hypothetical protein